MIAYDNNVSKTQFESGLDVFPINAENMKTLMIFLKLEIISMSCLEYKEYKEIDVNNYFLNNNSE
jgi:hypothetical protein